MMEDKALLPYPTPASKTGSGNEFLLLFSFILSMATLFLVFVVLLLARYYGHPKKLLKSDNEIGDRPKEKNRVSQPRKERLEEFDNAASDKLKESDSEKRESLQKLRDYGTFLKNAECFQYMVLFQKHSKSPPDKPLYTIAFYTPTLHYPDLKSAYTLSPCKSPIISAQATAQERPSFSPLSFFDGNTPRSIKPPSPVSDSKENISQWDSPSAISDSQQKWILSLSPISGSKQNTPQWAISDSEQTSSAWLLSPIASANGQDTPKWVLSPQGKSREGSDLYRIYSPHSSVPISPPITAFIIELETTPLSSKKKIDIEDIDNSSGSYSFSSPNSSP